MQQYNPYYNVPNYMYPQANRLNQMEAQYPQYSMNNGFIPNNTYNAQNQINNMQNNNLILQGKIVDSIDVVNAMDIPLDGSITYFPQSDGNVIYTKQLGMDGKRKVNTYKLDIGEKENKKEDNVNLNKNDIVKKEEIKKISDDITEVKNSISNLLDMVISIKSEVGFKQETITNRKTNINTKVVK